nr:PREDICTED: protamine-like [Latimeria chalumnae]|eukprot:XP_014339708.1 PREDICTED: protamine-like [Latimeria chalumnae]
MSRTAMGSRAQSPNARNDYSNMILTAVKADKGRAGTSAQSIQRYIKNNFKVGANADSRIKLTLKKLVAAGALMQTKRKGGLGSFKIIKAAPGRRRGRRRPRRRRRSRRSGSRRRRSRGRRRRRHRSRRRRRRRSRRGRRKRRTSRRRRRRRRSGRRRRARARRRRHPRRSRRARSRSSRSRRRRRRN